MQPMLTCHATSATGGSGIGRRLAITVPKAKSPAAESARAMPGRLLASRLRPAPPTRITTPQIPRTIAAICRELGRSPTIGQASNVAQTGIV